MGRALHLGGCFSRLHIGVWASFKKVTAPWQETLNVNTTKLPTNQTDQTQSKPKVRKARGQDSPLCPRKAIGDGER